MKRVHLFSVTLALLIVDGGSAFAVQGCNSSVPASTPTTQFTDHGDGTATDGGTSLMWKRCAEGQAWGGGTCTGTATSYTWQGALQQAKAINDGGGFAGNADWRLPNVRELRSLVEEQCYGPSINATIFPNTPSVFFWSASANVSYPGSAWAVYFAYGNAGGDLKGTGKPVRLVRAGQPFDSFDLAAAADLGVTQSALPDPAWTGKDLVYTLTVTNAPPIVATGVTLTDTLPAGSTFVWASPGCANASGVVTCTLGTLANAASTQVKLVVRPSAAGTATNNATVSGTMIDPNSANDSSSSTITVNTTPVATQALRYRLYGPVTLEHHFTTDLNEYTVLGGYVGTWVQEGTVGKVLNNPGSFNGVTALPYYRLYDTSTRWHHWTTDANEYYTLIQFPWWNGEGVDGYILPSMTIGATQLYRLLYPFVPGLHHWTIDPTEYGILISTYGWIGEGGSGFVVQ